MIIGSWNSVMYKQFSWLLQRSGITVCPVTIESTLLYLFLYITSVIVGINIIMHSTVIIVQRIKVTLTILTETFFCLKKFRKLRFLYKFPFQKIVTGVDWGHVKVYCLLYDLIQDNRTTQWKENFCVHN